MKYLSVCSGIEAASVAWAPLGWNPVAFSEIEPFPCAVLAHRFPDVPNWGDMTKYEDWPDADVDVLCGGTPCQSFSVAGLRKGLDDPRGNLMLTFGAIAGRYRPRWLVWENVPGVLSSNGGRDFGAFLGMLGQLGYGFAYRVLDAQYVRTLGLPFAVPQRRRRVFVVGYLGDWRRAAAVLFDRESLSGHPAPRREAGQGIAVSPTIRAGGNSTGGTRPPGTDVDTADSLVVANSDDVGYCADVASTLNAAFGSKLGLENQHIDSGAPLFVATAASAQHSLDAETGTETETLIAVAHALRGEGFDASEDGCGRGTPIVTVAFQERGRAGGRSLEYQDDVAYALTAPSGGGRAQERNIATHTAVRRLTPVECERLQGFPDGWTQVPYRNKPAADGPRYKAIGNSWATNCAEWIGERIAIVDQWRDA